MAPDMAECEAGVKLCDLFDLGGFVGVFFPLLVWRMLTATTSLPVSSAMS